MTAMIDFEKIGARIHQFYYDKYSGIFPQHYHELPEYMKEDNRAAARRIGLVLKNAGLRIAPRSGAHWSKEDQLTIQAIIDANLEILAEAEHDGWMHTRRRQGWRFVPADPNVGNKTPAEKEELRRQATDARQHFLLVPYHELDDKDKNKDRDSVKNYVEIIGQTDYKIELS
jgi:hypothetical protein